MDGDALYEKATTPAKVKRSLADESEPRVLKRVDRFPKMRAADRCGKCKTCLNPAMKKVIILLCT